MGLVCSGLGKNSRRRQLPVPRLQLDSLENGLDSTNLKSIDSAAISAASVGYSVRVNNRYRQREFIKLKQDWNKISKRKLLFMKMFEDILLSADSSDMFSKLPKVEKDGKDMTIEEHAAKVEKFFETCMNQDTFLAVWMLALALGRRHCTYGISFNAVYWLNIKKNMIKHIAPDETLPIHISWRKLIHDIIKGTRIGFNQGILAKLSERKTT